MLDDLKGKISNVSKELVNFHVKSVLNKTGERGVKFRNMTDDEKASLKSLVKDLQDQVNEFIEQSKAKAEAAKEEAKKEVKKEVKDVKGKKKPTTSKGLRRKRK